MKCIVTPWCCSGGPNVAISFRSAGAAGDVKEVQADGGFGAGTFTATQNGSERVRRYAICVGINKFVEQKLWANLDSACADAIKMHDVYVARVLLHRLIVLRRLKYAGYEVGDVLLDSAATAKSLRARITSVAQDEKCQCVFVFIATHGSASVRICELVQMSFVQHELVQSALPRRTHPAVLGHHSRRPEQEGRIQVHAHRRGMLRFHSAASTSVARLQIDEILAKHGVPHRVVVLDRYGAHVPRSGVCSRLSVRSCGQGWADDNPKRGRNVEGSSYSRSMMAAW